MECATPRSTAMELRNRLFQKNGGGTGLFKCQRKKRDERMETRGAKQIGFPLRPSESLKERVARDKEGSTPRMRLLGMGSREQLISSPREQDSETILKRCGVERQKEKSCGKNGRLVLPLCKPYRLSSGGSSDLNISYLSTVTRTVETEIEMRSGL